MSNKEANALIPINSQLNTTTERFNFQNLNRQRDYNSIYNSIIYFPFS